MNIRTAVSAPLEVLRAAAQQLAEEAGDYDALLRMAEGRDYVLLGEATHGTHEFYAMRAAITRRLVEEAGFDAVVVEGDWPDVLRLHRYAGGRGDDTLDQAFADFRRFPAWMWRNRQVREFVRWLRERNAARPDSSRVGIYGMDLYSLYRSADAVVAYLDTVDPEQAARARRLYACMDHVRDPQEYGAEAAAGLRPSCREAAATLLVELARQPQPAADAPDAADERFHAERNARLVLDAERYYRSLFGGRVLTWNLRDSHMTDTVLALRRHLRAGGRAGRIVVWAHNSHLGDARATQMAQRGEWNVGQLLREQAGPTRTLCIGFTTYTGHVTAARDWDAPAERRWVRPAHPDSYEHVLYRTGKDRFFLPLRGTAAQALSEPRLERAIGVVYRPETELGSHYFTASLAAQFDAIFHVDETSAVEPLEVTDLWKKHELPETYPFGL